MSINEERKEGRKKESKEALFMLKTLENQTARTVGSFFAEPSLSVAMVPEIVIRKALTLTTTSVA